MLGVQGTSFPSRGCLTPVDSMETVSCSCFISSDPACHVEPGEDRHLQENMQEMRFVISPRPPPQRHTNAEAEAASSPAPTQGSSRINLAFSSPVLWPSLPACVSFVRRLNPTRRTGSVTVDPALELRSPIANIICTPGNKAENPPSRFTAQGGTREQSSAYQCRRLACERTRP